MGDPGEPATETASAHATATAEELGALGKVTIKRMFGGYGLFESGTMFMMVDSKATLMFRADDTTAEEFKDARGLKHSRMPYWALPTAATDDLEQRLRWATKALEASRRAKKPSKKKPK